MTESTAVTTSHSYKIGSFSASEVLGKSWALFKEHMAELIVFVIVLAIAGQLPRFIVEMTLGKGGLASVLNLVLIGWNAFLALGTMRYLLAMVRGKKPQLMDVFTNTSNFVPFLIVYVVFAIAVGVGMIFLLVPGVIIALMYGYSTMLVADGKATGMDAFTMSAKMTEGHRMEIFIYWIVSAFLIIVGFIALIIPGLIASVVVGLGGVMMYEYLLANAPASASK